MKKNLLIGCGHSRLKRLFIANETEWDGELITLDMNPDCKPDVLHDLEVTPYPFEDNSIDEIHAYGVLEHLSDQGDYRAFFAQFSEFYRILKPNGAFLAIVPSEAGTFMPGTNTVMINPQQWGDPSHRRVINMITLAFLNQESYKQCGETMMTDFRNIYKGNFALAWSQAKEDLFFFVLKPIKEVPGWTSANTPKE